MNKRYLQILGALTGAAVVGYFSFSGADIETNYTPRSYGKMAGSEFGAYELMESLKANAETGKIEQSDYINARAEIEAMEVPSNRTAFNWVERGPNNIAGRIRAILPFNNDTNQIIVGGVSGGLFKSNNSGLNWHKISTFDDNLAVSSIAMAGNGTILVGTGNRHEGSPSGTGGSRFHGNGMYVSYDNGETWAHAEDNNGVELKPDNMFSTSQPWSRITDMKRDPVNPDIIHIMASQGYVTYNTETKVVTPKLNPIGQEGESISLSADGQTILVSLNARVWVSHDGGDNFTQLWGANSPLPGGSGPPVTRAEVAVSPDNKDIMYASYTNSASYLFNVYGSNDGGETWSIVWNGHIGVPPANSPFAQYDPLSNSLQGQGFYNSVLMVIPGQPNRFMVGGIDVWMGGFGSVPERRSRWFLPKFLPEYVHADIHRMVYDAAGVAYIGSDGGFTKSYDNLNTFRTLNLGLNITQFYNMSYGPYDEILGGTQDNGTLYIENEATNPMRGRQVIGGDGFACYLSQLNPDVSFGSVYNGDIRRSAENGASGSYERFDLQIQSFFGSANLGGFFTEFNAWEIENDPNSPDSVTFANISLVENILPGTVLEIESRNMRLPFEYTVEDTIFAGESIRIQDPVQTLFAAGYGSEGLWVTRDAFKFDVEPTWFRLIPSISGGTKVIEFSQDGDHLWIGSFSGQLWRISGLRNAYTAEDFQENVTVTAFSGSAPSAITGIAINPNNPDDVVITVGGFGNYPKVRRSLNATNINNFTNFASVAGDLPNMPVYYPVIEHTNGENNILIVGTEFGIWASENGGANWFEANDGDMPKVPVMSLKQQWRPGDKVSNPGKIYAGTHGRGFFHSDTYLQATTGISDVAGLLSKEKLAVKLYPNPASSHTNVEFKLNKRANATFRIFDLQGKLIRQVERPNLPKGEHVFNLNVANLNSGMYLLNIELDNNITESVRFVVK
jgi:hypothetical protein